MEHTLSINDLIFHATSSAAQDDEVLWSFAEEQEILTIETIFCLGNMLVITPAFGEDCTIENGAKLAEALTKFFDEETIFSTFVK